jgi:hypothetical protein
MSGKQEAVANAGIGLSGKIIGLIFEILVGLRPEGVSATHWIPNFFKCSSNRRCWLSQ